MDGFAERLAQLRREAQQEWTRRVKQRRREKPGPREWRRLGTALLQGLLRLAAIVALPFVVLVRGAVFLYEHGNVPTWLALLVAALLTIGLVTLYASWLLRTLTGRSPALLLAKWVALPLVVHAVDLRTVNRGWFRNRLVQVYFWTMGFSTLRHVGTADHLHVDLR